MAKKGRVKAKDWNRMHSEPKPSILASITFLTPDEGGRQHLPTAGYMPHLCVMIDGRGELGPDSGCPYLGVWFVGAPSAPAAGEPGTYELELMYHPEVDYSVLRKGTKFAVMEGPHVVGRGTVVEGAH